MYIVIAGAGRLGLVLANKLKEDKHQVCLIDKNESLCHRLAAELQGIMIIGGDATYPEVLREAKMEKAVVCVSATSRDEDNIIVCNLAKELFGVRRTVARVNDPKHLPLYKYMQIDNPVDSISIVAHFVEQEASFTDFVKLLSIQHGRLSVVRVDIPPDSPVANKLVKNIQLPANAVLVSVVRGTEIIIPSGSTKIQPSDGVIAATLLGNEKELIKGLVGKL
jgi:trk system potassium uptake protein TrkA